MYDRAQEHRPIRQAAREFRRGLKAWQKELGFETKEELRRYLTHTRSLATNPPEENPNNAFDSEP